MAEYLAPGVYIEETSFRQSTIEGVSTSVAGIVGPTRYGPVRGRPLLVTSIAEFENYFGDLSDSSLGGTDGRNYTALGARAFFDNGGKQLYVARITRDVAETGDPAQRASHGVLAARAAGADAASAAPITFEARFPGGGGNLDVVMRPRPGASRLTMARSTDDADDLLLRLTNVTKAQLVAPAAAVPDAQFPLRRLVALAKHKPAADGAPEQYAFDAGQKVYYVDSGGAVHFVDPGEIANGVAVDDASRAAARKGTLAAPDAQTGAAPVYAVPGGPVLAQYLGLTPPPAWFYATGNAGGTLTFSKALNAKLAADVTVPAALAAADLTPAQDGAGAVFSNNCTTFLCSVGSPRCSAPRPSRSRPTRPTTWRLRCLPIRCGRATR